MKSRISYLAAAAVVLPVFGLNLLASKPAAAQLSKPLDKMKGLLTPSQDKDLNANLANNRKLHDKYAAIVIIFLLNSQKQPDPINYINNILKDDLNEVAKTYSGLSNVTKSEELNATDREKLGQLNAKIFVSVTAAMLAESRYDLGTIKMEKGKNLTVDDLETQLSERAEPVFSSKTFMAFYKIAEFAVTPSSAIPVGKFDEAQEILQKKLIPALSAQKIDGTTPEATTMKNIIDVLSDKTLFPNGIDKVKDIWCLSLIAGKNAALNNTKKSPGPAAGWGKHF